MPLLTSTTHKPSATKFTTVRKQPTATPTPSPTPSPTNTPSPSPSPTPSQLSVKLASVNWQATKGDHYYIFYGKADPPDTQIDAGSALQHGPMSAVVSLEPGTTYFCSD